MKFDKDKYELLGFDIRLSSEDYIGVFLDQERRDLHLIKPDISWPLSVDIMVWPSFFCYDRDRSGPAYFQFNGTIDITPHNTRHLALELWSNLDEMRSYFLKQKNKLTKKWFQLAIVLRRDNFLQSDDFWRAVLDPPLSIDKLPKDWLFLGYDIADRDMISGLSNCGYDAKEKYLIQKTWSSRLNEYGLLKNLEDAMQFKNLSNQRVPEHKPFYVYGLFRDPHPIKERK